MSDAPMSTDRDDTFDEWVILEMLGHRRLSGRLTERQIAGQPFLQLTIPGDDTDDATQFYAPASVYAITPVSEEIARHVAQTTRFAPPVHRWELPAATAAVSEDEGDLF